MEHCTACCRDACAGSDMLNIFWTSAEVAVTKKILINSPIFFDVE